MEKLERIEIKKEINKNRKRILISENDIKKIVEDAEQIGVEIYYHFASIKITVIELLEELEEKISTIRVMTLMEYLNEGEKRAIDLKSNITEWQNINVYKNRDDTIIFKEGFCKLKDFIEKFLKNYEKINMYIKNDLQELSEKFTRRLDDVDIVLEIFKEECEYTIQTVNALIQNINKIIQNVISKNNAKIQ